MLSMPHKFQNNVIVYYDMRLGSGYYRIEEMIIKTKFCNTLHKRVLYSIFSRYLF
ncbi:hypothetical protein C0J52_01297 [Blattella germanica]|nr:hypothetical protein C0J52_01297 [Blattella germanica]